MEVVSQSPPRASLPFRLITYITLRPQYWAKLKTLEAENHVLFFSLFWRQSYRDSQIVRSVLQRRYIVSTMIQLLFSDKGATTTFVKANLHTWQLKSHIGGDNMCTGRKIFFLDFNAMTLWLYKMTEIPWSFTWTVESTKQGYQYGLSG